MNPIFANLPPTIFEVMSRRARETGAINLGQGFPDQGPPADIVEVAARALAEQSHQYPPMLGLPVLRQAIADHYARHQGLDLSPDEVIVSSGATEALAAAIFAVVSPGDEVIVIEPAYDVYVPLVRRAGGVVRTVRLEPPEWRVTRAALEAAVSERTRAIIVNSPMNPTGTMLSEDEAALIADLCVSHDLIAICDEVWEHVVFDGRVHRPLMAIPAMRERAIKIGSAGKIFSATGWKVGWMCAAPEIATVLGKAHQFLTFTTPPNLQAAVAYGLGKDESYFAEMRAGYQASRDRLAEGLRANGYAVLPSAATWFVTIDLAASSIDADDVSWCEALVSERGVAAIPVSAFYVEDGVRSVVRLCHAKLADTITTAMKRLSLEPGTIIEGPS